MDLHNRKRLLCGEDEADYVATDRSVYLHFETDAAIEKRGFKIAVTFGSSTCVCESLFVHAVLCKSK